MTHRDSSWWTRRSFVASAAAGLVPWHRVRRDSIDEFVKAAMKRHPTPGVAAGAVTSGRSTWTQGYGFANLERQFPMTPDTILNVGSVTKTVTATSVMQLVEGGRLDLDADVNEVLPFPVRNPAFPSSAITARQLLTHTSSIADSPDYLASYACGDPAAPLADWVSKYLQPTGARYRSHRHFTRALPGAAWDYSNVGFGLLGVVIEVLAQSSYADYTVTHVLEPLRMNSTGWYLGRIDQAGTRCPIVTLRAGRPWSTRCVTRAGYRASIGLRPSFPIASTVSPRCRTA